MLVFFDLLVWITGEIQWNQRHTVYREAKEAGYTEDYTICSRQGSVEIDGHDYLSFRARRHVVVDGDYQENLLVSKEDQFEDTVLEQEENLEIFAKKVKSTTGPDGEPYTVIDIYRIDNYGVAHSDAWFWRAFMLTIIVAPIVFVLGMVWLVRSYHQRVEG